MNYRVNLTNSQKKRIEEKYKAGMEMEEVAVSLGIDLVQVSRHIHNTGLGAKRYVKTGGTVKDTFCPFDKKPPRKTGGRHKC